MRRGARVLAAFLGIAMLAGLSFVGAPEALAVSGTAKKSFIADIVSSAQAAQRQYGVPASVSIAQAAVNTDYGTSALATSAANLFGIRCTANLSATQFAKLAEAQVGKAYVLGAEASIDNANPKAFDCSELVQWLFGRSGNPITDLAASQYNVTSAVTGSPQVGDLVFLRNNPARANGIGHVAVVTKKQSDGDWEIIEARGHAYGVVKTTLSYWKSRKYYAGLRRYAKLNFVGESGVTTASAASPFQAGCISITASGKTIKYAKFSTAGDSIMGHAAMVAEGTEYAAARKALNDVSAFASAVAAAEQPDQASAYAKSLKAVIAEYDLTQYDVAPMSLVLTSTSSGPKVTALQYLLTAAGKKVATSGKYDSATVSAVKAFQSSKKLDVDGEAGPATITALMATVKQGDSTTRVSALNTLLALAGFGTDALDTFGKTTAASLSAFQASAGLTATGTADAKTWSRLFMLLDVVSVPTVTGTTTVGQTLAAVPGTWGPGKVDLAYQWLRDDKEIAGAGDAAYQLQPEDAGHAVRVMTTGVKAGYTAVSRFSTPTVAIAPAKLSATPTPKITGSAVAGKVLTAVPGAWLPAPVNLSFQWFRGDKPIVGATAASYQLQAADYKAALHVIVTGARLGYYSATKASAPTAGVKAGTTTVTAAPQLTGTVAVGQTLTATPGTWTPMPTGFSYQWYRDKTAIPGATAPTYTIGTADTGKTLKVKVTNTGGAFAKVSATSAPTAAVAKLAWAAIGEPALSGTAKVGKKLTVGVGTWSPAPKFTYTWYRGKSAIAHANKASYTLTRADKGKTITVKVTAKKAGYPTVVKKVSIKAA